MCRRGLARQLEEVEEVVKLAVGVATADRDRRENGSEREKGGPQSQRTRVVQRLSSTREEERRRT
jgi:hypothetical protein